MKAANYRRVHSYQPATEVLSKPTERIPNEEYTLGRKDSLASFILSGSARTGRAANSDSPDFQNEAPRPSETDKKTDLESCSEEDSDIDSVVDRSEGNNSDKEELDDFEDSYTEPDSNSASGEEYTSFSDTDDNESHLGTDRKEVSSVDEHNIIEQKDASDTDEISIATEDSSEETKDDSNDDEYVMEVNTGRDTRYRRNSDKSESSDKSSDNLMATSKAVSFLEDSSSNLAAVIQTARKIEDPQATVEDIENDYFTDVFYMSDDSCEESKLLDVSDKSYNSKIHHNKASKGKQVSSLEAKEKHKDGGHRQKKGVPLESGKTSPHQSKHSKNHPTVTVKHTHKLEPYDPGVFKEQVKPATLTKKESKARKPNAKSVKKNPEKHLIKSDQKPTIRNSENLLTVYDIHPKWGRQYF